MDFIVKLLRLENVSTGVKYNSILVVVDKLIKYAHLIFCKEDFIVKQMIYIILDKVMRYHGIPKSITSDRDKIFKSNFWKTLIIKIGTKIKLSIVYHSQTNEQTERINQTLETYLQHYMNYSQRNWIRLLLMAQLILNNTKATATEFSTFYANYDRYPNLFNTLRKLLQAVAALEDVKQLKQIHEKISKNIEYNQR